MHLESPPSNQLVVHDFASLQSGAIGTCASLGLQLVVLSDVVAGDAGAITRHHRDFFSLYVARRGSGNHLIDGKSYSVVRGDVFVMWPGMEHWFDGGDDLWFDTIHFQTEMFDSQTQDILAKMAGFSALMLADSAPDSNFRFGGRWLHLTPVAYEQVSTWMSEIRDEWRSGTLDGMLVCRATFLRLLIFLARARARSAPTDAAIHKAGHAATVAAAIRYMEDGFAGQLRIEQVASAVFLSPDRFTEVFSAEVGMTPRAYVRRLRVERAVSLLQTTELTLATVAEQSGFADAAHLSRVVREVTGDTPRTVRLRAQQSAGRGRLVLESWNGDTTPVA